jgi:hypothetical protein
MTAFSRESIMYWNNIIMCSLGGFYQQERVVGRHAKMMDRTSCIYLKGPVQILSEK